MTIPTAYDAPVSVSGFRCALAWVITAVAATALRSVRFHRIERLARWLMRPIRRSASVVEIDIMLAAIDRAGGWLPVRVACLERSLAVVMWCGLLRRSVCWRIGVRSPPFTAHAWVEAAGRPVGELVSLDSYQPILTIGHPHREKP
ncbi:MAG: lasso peptide biosynthesis B2 protein [Pseudonocardiaceae bacterium]